MLMWMIEYAVCGSLLLHIGLGVVADFMSSLILAVLHVGIGVGIERHVLLIAGFVPSLIPTSTNAQKMCVK